MVATNRLFSEDLHVLLVDEDFQNLTEMKHLLESNTYKVTSEGSITTALYMILGNECPHDIVIAEIAMPYIDGFKFLQKIRVQGSNFPVILMTANVEPGMEAKASEFGATMFFKKPIPNDILINILEKIPLQKQLTPFYKNGGISTFSSIRAPKVSWPDELQREFFVAVTELGEKKAKPQAILKKMKSNNPNSDLLPNQISNYLRRSRAQAKKLVLSIVDLMPDLAKKQVNIPSYFISEILSDYPISSMLMNDNPIKELNRIVPKPWLDGENNLLDWEVLMVKEVGIPFHDIRAFIQKDCHQLTWCLDDLANLLY